MKDKMLVIPGSFVPFNDTVTLLTYKRLKYLDLDMDVLALKNSVDESLLATLEKEEDFKKFHIEYFTDYDSTVPLKKPYLLPLGIINSIRYTLKSRKKAGEKEYKYLFTSSIPSITHFCGLAIKKRYPNIKWYASFSDPLKGSPFVHDPEVKKANILYQFVYNVGTFFLMNEKYEEAAVNYADKLIFICEEQRDFTISQYPGREKELLDKSVILPLVYVADWKMYTDLLETKTVNNTPKIASHLGRLYGLRRIGTFLQALKEMKEEDSELSKKIVFHQYSDIQKEYVKYVKENHLEDVFVIHGKVNYKQSLDVMKNSDILVLFDTLMEGAPVQPYLPSKIVEYLLLKKPILGYCDTNSPSYRILKEYGYSTVGYTVDDVKKNIKLLIEGVEVPQYQLDELEAKHHILEL